MYFIAERIRRQCDELKRLVVTARQDVAGIQMRRGRIPADIPPSSLADGFEDFMNGGVWSAAGSDEYALFRFQVRIPECTGGQAVSLAIRTNRTGWNALNPQMLCYLDGREHQGLDTNHGAVLLDRSARAGDLHEVMLYAFSGLTLTEDDRAVENDVRLFVTLEVSDEQVEGLYFDLSVPLQYVERLPAEHSGRIRTLAVLNAAVNLLDFRRPYSVEFLGSVDSARSRLKENLYGALSGEDADATCVGHTHIDVAWLWRYAHTRDKTARSFATVLSLMEQYPNIHSCPANPSCTNS